MQQTAKPVSKTRIVLLWVLLVGNIIFWFTFFFLRGRGHTSQATGTGGSEFVRSFIMVIIGGFFFIVGLVGYIVVIFSDGFTFRFDRPIWRALKGKLYLANILVPTALALGVGLAIAAVVSPFLLTLGLSGSLARMLPVLVTVVLLQIAQVWVLIWAPLERRAITKRLLAEGITKPQLDTAVLVGISNPQRSSFKKFAQVEEDIGALWVGPEQLVYWGDTERWGVTRDQLVQLERKADTGSATMLGGLAHVILHVRAPGADERQIRLHTEGVWTMGQKRQAMDRLAAAILQWHDGPNVPAAT